MRRADDGYRVEVPAVRRSFTYRVGAGALASADYAVTALEPPGIERIEVAYRYPEHLALPARVDTGGDIHAPEGTTVTVTVVADKPVRSGALRLGSGGTLDLERRGERQWAGSLDVIRDDSYRVALVDADALTNGDAADYLIRTRGRPATGGAHRAAGRRPRDHPAGGDGDRGASGRRLRRRSASSSSTRWPAGTSRRSTCSARGVPAR